MSEIKEVETKALTVLDQAKAIKVVDTESYTLAGGLWKSIKDMMKEVADTFDPIIEKAHASHKEALAQKAKFYAPLEKAYKDVKRIMSDYDAEQERIRQAEQERLRKIAEEEERKVREAEAARIAAEAKAREDELLAAASVAEVSGDKQQAESLMAAAVSVTEEAQQEVQAIAAEPVYVPPVNIPKAVPKVSGGPVYRTIYKHQVIDLMALVKAVAAGHVPIIAIQANDTFLGQQARSLKEAMRIPGVRAYSERC